MSISTIVCDVSTAVHCCYVPPIYTCIGELLWLTSFTLASLHMGNTTSGHSSIRLVKHELWCQKVGMSTVTQWRSTFHLCYTTHDAWFNRIHLDIVGPLPPSNGFTYLLTLCGPCDTVTHWPEASPIADITAETVANANRETYKPTSYKCSWLVCTISSSLHHFNWLRKTDLIPLWQLLVQLLETKNFGQPPTILL